MSNAWKIAQGLKSKTQSDSFGRDKFSMDTTGYSYKSLKQMIRDDNWAKSPSFTIFNRYDEDRNIADIKSYLQEMQYEGKVLNNFKIGEILISIDAKNPKRITFSSAGNIGNEIEHLYLKYPYTITICGDDIYSEVDIIDNNFRDGLSAVYEEKGESSVPIRVSQKVSVINGETINESFDIYLEKNKYSKKKNIDIQHITEMVVKNNPEYEIGDDGEIYREDIDPEEKIRKFQSERELTSKRKLKSKRKSKSERELTSEGETLLSTDLATIYETHSDYDRNYKNHSISSSSITLDSYGDGIPIAKEIEEHCKYIYSLFAEAYKELSEKDKVTDEKENGLSETIESSDGTEVKNEESIYNGVNIEELDDTQLEKFIGEMDSKQTENERRIKRLQKIKRAKELITLNKNQDRIISDLEKQIQTEGVDFGEQ